MAASGRSFSLEGSGSDWHTAPSDSIIAGGGLRLGFHGGRGGGVAGGWPAPSATTTTTPTATLVGSHHSASTSSTSAADSSSSRPLHPYHIPQQQILNYNPVPQELNMVGLRDVFLFHSSQLTSDQQQQPSGAVFPVLSSPAVPQEQQLLHPPPFDRSDHTHRRDHHSSEIQLWHQHLAGQRTAPDTGISSEFVSGGSTTCQDCGNQAKKDCSHRRCRSCCKSRGFECLTHVKSTWVPAARRRERQQQLLQSSSGGVAAVGKKPRLGPSSTSVTSTSATTPSRSFDTDSSHQDQMEMGGSGFPAHVSAPAVFKCLRVTSIEDGEDEYAYQAAVKINGRVFKGFLYDQGQDDSSSSSLLPVDLSELQLGDHLGAGKNANAPSLSSTLEGAGDAYAAGTAVSSSTGMLGVRSNYGNPMN